MWFNSNGLRVTYGWGWTLEQLSDVVSRCSPVIVPTQYKGHKEGHYVIVTGVGLNSVPPTVRVQDPLTGLAQVNANEFDKSWHDVGADGMKDDHFAIAVHKPQPAEPTTNSPK